MRKKLETCYVLDTEMTCATYESALENILELAKLDKPTAVSASNTHIISLARHDKSFGQVLQKFDMVLPDGMPLIWSLNRNGAGLKDRVYGPYLMQYVLEKTPKPYKHFLFGGSERCLNRLKKNISHLMPHTEIVGAYSPPFRKWEEKDLEEFAEIINTSKADFVWIALGGERQERWIIENQHRFKKGVYFAIGDAFELLAGNRPFAPRWMQKKGLTWLYRLIQEPKRLWIRYFKYNSLFIYYTLLEILFRSKVKPKKIDQEISVAFLGSRGVPARYSGFETVVEQVGYRLVERGYDVTVYNRSFYYDEPICEWRGMKVVSLPAVASKSFETILHTTLSSFHALFQNYDVVYLCGVGNSLLANIFKLTKSKIIINVDGADSERRKWSGFAKAWLSWSEIWAIDFSYCVIADNKQIVTRYQNNYQFTPKYLSYGANIKIKKGANKFLERFSLKPKRYILYVSRLTPENQADLLIEAYIKSGVSLPLAVVGNVGYEKEYFRKLARLANKSVLFLGGQFGDSYIELSQNSAFFVMPATIEATRLVLLDQMGMGKAILYQDCPATREVVGDAAVPFSSKNASIDLVEKLKFMVENPSYCEEFENRAIERVKEKFNWEKIVDEYENIFNTDFTNDG